MGTSTRAISDQESCRLVQGSIGRHAEYIPEHGPKRDSSPVGSRRYAGYSVQPVSAGGKEVCRKAALNGSGTACFHAFLFLYRRAFFIALWQKQFRKSIL